MEIKDSDKRFILKYEDIGIDCSAAKFGCLFWVLLLIICPISLIVNLSCGDNRGADNSMLCFIVFLPVFLVYFVNYLSSLNLYEKELHLDKTKAKRQYEFLKNDVAQFPFFQQICILNRSAKSRQFELLEKWYGVGGSIIQTYVYDMEYSENCVTEEINILKNKDFSVRKELVDRLFKLAVLDDGIHVDEWKFLMDMMKELKFNKNYIVYFKKRYGPLRTEFDEAEYENSSSTKTETVSTLNPYYAILGVEDGATDEEIKRAYHNLALQHHPDLPKNAGRVEECEAMMVKINEAYEKIRG